MALADPRRAEDRDALLDVAEGIEPFVDLLVDPLQPQVVFGLEVPGGAEQLAVALRASRTRAFRGLVFTAGTRSAPGGIRTRAARLKRPPL
jgi:hypothetical protein